MHNHVNYMTIRKTLFRSMFLAEHEKAEILDAIITSFMQ